MKNSISIILEALKDGTDAVLIFVDGVQRHFKGLKVAG